jgi:hypothetical protein
MKDETKFHEENISEKFYKDYKAFKDQIFENLVKNNPQYDKITLFKKSQKLLDRFLFVLFAEDIGLCPPNSIQIIIDQWKRLQDDAIKCLLYSRFQKMFEYLDKGHKGKYFEFPAYNGGLFKPDELLDNEKTNIENFILLEHCPKLSAYDFSTDIDVNILGHIFEHSLNEIEGIERELTLTKFETLSKLPTKRKKDGIFYTPKYITSYIVENTIGKLCQDKQTELNLTDFQNLTDLRDKNGKITKQGKELYIKFQEYKNWLLTLKILDPACGSGAFLNAALDFLINEHNQIDDLISDLTGDRIRLFATDATILDNNIFGVDINEESVEIAKLSLWLMTAKKECKLSDLNNNIKCGDSLIDNSEIAGDKAFNWNDEFSEIMNTGGFDVVIGNPPYFNIQTYGVGSTVCDFLKSDYSEIYQDKSDILFYFIKKALDISRNYVSFIISNAFLFSDKAQRLRNWLLNNADIIEIINFEQYLIFQDASITSLILTLRKGKYSGNTNIINFKDKILNPDIIANQIRTKTESYSVSFEKNKPWALIKTDLADIYKKIDGKHPKLEDLMLVGKGMETAANEVFIFESIPSDIPVKFFKKRISGVNIEKYYIDHKSDYLLYIEDLANFEELPFSIQQHLIKNKPFLENRADKKRRKSALWWNFTFPLHKENYHLPKLFCSYRSSTNAFVYDNGFEYISLTNGTVIFETNIDYSVKFIICLLNSKLLTFRYKGLAKQTGGGIFEFLPNSISKIPIPALDKSNQIKFIELADKIIVLKKQFNQQLNKVLERITDNLKCKISEKIKLFYLSDFRVFLDELTKQKIKISLTNQDEWKDYLNNSSNVLNYLNNQITEIDNEINKKVYELFNLSPAEVALVKGTD